jgi:hypothetical protein
MYALKIKLAWLAVGRGRVKVDRIFLMYNISVLL